MQKWIFITEHTCVISAQIKTRNVINSPETPLCVPFQRLTQPLPPSWRLSWLPTPWISLACFRTSCEWNHTVCAPACPAAYTQYCICDVHVLLCGLWFIRFRCASMLLGKYQSEIFSQPSFLHEGNRERKQFDYSVNIEPECVAYHRQSTKRSWR